MVTRYIVLVVLVLTVQVGCKSESEVTSPFSNVPPPKQSAVSVCSPLLEDSRKLIRADELLATQECGTEDVDLVGKIEIISANTNNGEILEHHLRTSDGRKSILLSNQGLDGFSSGSEVRVSGKRSFCGVVSVNSQFVEVVETSSVQPRVLALSASDPKSFSLGEQKVAVFLLNFSDENAPFSKVQVRDMVFTQVNNYYKENSFQKTWLTGDVFGSYTLSIPKSVCDTDKIANEAVQKAVLDGVDVNAYSRWIYIFPETSQCPWYGLGSVGSKESQAWINGDLALHTIAHEIGHNVGLFHSNGLNCGGSSAGLGCTNIEYGDTADSMGNKQPGHFTAYQKERLGWLNYATAPEIQTVSSTGVYAIEPYSSAPGLKPKAIKVLRSNNSNGTKTFYYVEYRQSIGFDSIFSTLLFSNNLTSGVLVHRGNDTNGNSSYMLNMNPALGSWYKAALMSGQTFTDQNYGIAISLVSNDTSGANVGINYVPITQPVTCVSP